MTHITKQLEELQQRIKTAALEAGRNETEVSVLAVSKRHDQAAIKAAQASGLIAFGENYLQEALQKIPLIKPPVEWHFIGQVQSNKTAAIAENFDWVQTVSSEKIVRRLAKQRPEHLAPLNICLQVCTDDSPHNGIRPEQAARLCELVESYPRLRLRGLMTIPAAKTDFTDQRAPFRVLKELFADLQQQGHSLDTLSMGMSMDLEAAIHEGSTLLRIGTALFGPRPV